MVRTRRVRRLISYDLDKELANIKKAIQKKLNVQLPIFQASKIAAGKLGEKKITLKKRGRVSWEVFLE